MCACLLAVGVLGERGSSPIPALRTEEEKPLLQRVCCVPASAACSDYSRMPWQHSLAPSPVLSNGSLNEGTLPSISKSCDGHVTPLPPPIVRITQPALLCRRLHSPPVPSRDSHCGVESRPSWVWVQLTRCRCHGNSTLIQWISHHQYPPPPPRWSNRLLQRPSDH